jgi:hypothetical protein
LPPAAPTQTSGQRPGRHRQLGAHLVAGIDHHVHRARQPLRPVGRLDEVLHRLHPAGGVDLRDALLQRQHLGLAQRGLQRLHLAVDVGLGHVVQVDQHQAGHAAARQRLGSPGSHAADAHHRHPQAAQAGVGGVAVQAPQAAEAALQVDVVQLGEFGRHGSRSRRQPW